MILQSRMEKPICFPFAKSGGFVFLAFFLLVSFLCVCLVFGGVGFVFWWCVVLFWFGLFFLFVFGLFWGFFSLSFMLLLKQAANDGLVPVSLTVARFGGAPEEEIVSTEGMQWESGADLGNPRALSSTLGWFLQEQQRRRRNTSKRGGKEDYKDYVQLDLCTLNVRSY